MAERSARGLAGQMAPQPAAVASAGGGRIPRATATRTSSLRLRTPSPSTNRCTYSPHAGLRAEQREARFPLEARRQNHVHGAWCADTVRGGEQRGSGRQRDEQRAHDGFLSCARVVMNRAIARKGHMLDRATPAVARFRPCLGRKARRSPRHPAGARRTGTPGAKAVTHPGRYPPQWR